jgi:hypothetical protein
VEAIGELRDIMGFMTSNCNNSTNALSNARLFYDNEVLDVTRSSDVADNSIY